MIEDTDEPKGMEKIMLQKESTAILESIQKEVQAFNDIDVFDELPKRQQTLPSHIIVKRKYTIDPKTGLNKFTRWKARIVFNGKKQKDHSSTYSSTYTLLRYHTDNLSNAQRTGYSYTSTLPMPSVALSSLDERYT